MTSLCLYQGNHFGSHVKGALIYNYQIHKLGLQYLLIQRGDKIKFIKLKEANFSKFDVISYD